MADTTVNFPDAGVALGGDIEISMPASEVRLAGSFTTTPFVYICDSGNHRIQVTDYDGNPLFSFGSFGTGDGEFDSPYGVSNDGERVYVTDSGNHRVQYFDLYGNYLGQWGAMGSANGEFITPKGIAVDDGHVYVVDQGNNRFQIFTKEGFFILWADDCAEGGTKLNAPTNCYVDSVFLWIDDTGNGHIDFYPKTTDTSMYGNAVLPFFTLSAVLKNNCSRGSATLAPLRMQSLGAVMATARVSRGAAVLPALGMVSPGAMMATEHHMVGAAVLPAFSLSARMVTARAMQGAAVLPAFTLSAILRRAASLQGAAVLPALRLVSTMYTVKAAPGFAGMAVNLRNKAITKYSGFNFTGFAVLNGKLYGTSAAGIHLLEGSDDNGVAIDAVLRTGRFDLHAEQVRRIVDAWLSARFAGQAVLRVHETEGDTDDVSEYDIDGEDGALHDERIPFERGHEGRFVEFEIVNVDGSDFDLAGWTTRLRDIARPR
jgi:hypothetical protein